MIKLKNGKVIYDEIRTILEALRIETLKRGLFDYLRVIKPNNDNIQVCCPYHKDGKERRPSAGLNIRPTSTTKDTGTFHCFTCGEVKSFGQYISKCLEVEDNGKVGEDWLVTNFIVGEGNKRSTIIDQVLYTREPTDIEYITEEELATYRYTHPYMYERKLTDDIIEMFDVGFDRYYNCITFPVNDLNGNCVFIARRAIKYKMFNYPENVEKPVYGLDKILELMEQGVRVNTIYVCESSINALTLWGYGLFAVALLGTGTKSQYDILTRFNVRKYITAFDGDEAGDKATLRFNKGVKGKIIVNLFMPDGLDVNDLTYEEFRNLKEY